MELVFKSEFLADLAHAELRVPDIFLHLQKLIFLKGFRRGHPHHLTTVPLKAPDRQIHTSGDSGYINFSEKIVIEYLKEIPFEVFLIGITDKKRIHHLLRERGNHTPEKGLKKA